MKNWLTIFTGFVLLAGCLSLSACSSQPPEAEVKTGQSDSKVVVAATSPAGETPATSLGTSFQGEWKLENARMIVERELDRANWPSLDIGCEVVCEVAHTLVFERDLQIKGQAHRFLLVSSRTQGFDCPECAPVISGFLFKAEGQGTTTGWRLVEQQTAIAQMGNHGSPGGIRPALFELEVLPDDRLLLLMQSIKIRELEKTRTIQAAIGFPFELIYDKRIPGVEVSATLAKAQDSSVQLVLNNAEKTRLKLQQGKFVTQ